MTNLWYVIDPLKMHMHFQDSTSFVIQLVSKGMYYTSTKINDIPPSFFLRKWTKLQIQFYFAFVGFHFNSKTSN